MTTDTENTTAGGHPLVRQVRPVAELRELAQDGAAMHTETMPERIVCDGLLWALDEIERLAVRAAGNFAGAVAAQERADAAASEIERLRSVLLEASEARWACATEDGACPDCGCDDGEPHADGCLLGRIDAEIDGPNVRAKPDTTAE